jgi:hypothetical protein
MENVKDTGSFVDFNSKIIEMCLFIAPRIKSVYPGSDFLHAAPGIFSIPCFEREQNVWRNGELWGSYVWGISTRT